MTMDSLVRIDPPLTSPVEFPIYRLDDLREENDPHPFILLVNPMTEDLNGSIPRNWVEHKYLTLMIVEVTGFYLRREIEVIDDWFAAVPEIDVAITFPRLSKSPVNAQRLSQDDTFLEDFLYMVEGTVDDAYQQNSDGKWVAQNKWIEWVGYTIAQGGIGSFFLNPPNIQALARQLHQINSLRYDGTHTIISSTE
jgi:hypothetical protein